MNGKRVPNRFLDAISQKSEPPPIGIMGEKWLKQKRKVMKTVFSVLIGPVSYGRHSCEFDFRV
ncbi:hypothetical protein B4113_2697 [Geobacillus sp. B4113_201601]|nr:hypothetical protein B4113_2697 [Geobacillus sp. B4113_201601]